MEMCLCCNSLGELLMFLSSLDDCITLLTFKYVLLIGEEGRNPSSFFVPCKIRRCLKGVKKSGDSGVLTSILN